MAIATDLEFDVDVKEGTVSFELPKAQYSMDAVQIAAHVFDKKVEVLFDEDKTTYSLTLQAKRRGADESALAALGGEYLNELLNQEYRFVVGKFNQKISSLIVAQALLAARGGENPSTDLPAEEKTPEFKAEVERLLKAAADEVKRTMPAKLPPQGQVLPPEKEPRV